MRTALACIALLALAASAYRREFMVTAHDYSVRDVASI
jgi:hypothetical protein